MNDFEKYMAGNHGVLVMKTKRSWVGEKTSLLSLPTGVVRSPTPKGMVGYSKVKKRSRALPRRLGTFLNRLQGNSTNQSTRS